MQNPLTRLIVRQTDITLYNIQVVLSTCKLEEEFMEQPVWRLIYSMLRRLDCGIIEPAELRRDPDFHTGALADLAVPYNGKPLTKEYPDVILVSIMFLLWKYVMKLRVKS